MQLKFEKKLRLTERALAHSPNHANGSVLFPRGSRLGLGLWGSASSAKEMVRTIIVASLLNYLSLVRFLLDAETETRTRMPRPSAVSFFITPDVY